MKDMIKINIKIGTFSYCLDIKREEEAIFRESSHKVNNLLKKFGEKFGERKEPELLGMVAMQLAYELEKEKVLNKNQ